ncbi:MAG: FHA domain-containing protein [Planctomyces sp.]|nr:FHA domain-containing protein [Planctomyces sp.]
MLERFAKHCGSSRQLQVTFALQDSNDWKTVVLPGPFAILGRGDDSSIPLTNPLVSRRHVYLQVIDDQVFFADLGSRAGLKRDGRRVSSGVMTRDDSLEVGPYRLRAEAIPNSAVDAPGDAEFPPDIPDLALDFVNHRNTTKPLKLTRRVTLIGSARPCNVRLEHESVSRVHCSIVRGDRGWWLVDLGSRTGTRLDGVRVSFAPLSLGAEVKVGSFRMLLRDAITLDDSDDTSILTDPASEAEAAQHALRRAAAATPQATQAVPQDLVVELFREFTALHERTVVQLQQSFRELLTLAIARRPGLPLPDDRREPPSPDVPRSAALIETTSEMDAVEATGEISVEVHELLAERIQSIASDVQRERNDLAVRLLRQVPQKG